MVENKKLCRSMSDKAILGVCSGFAKYFDIDPIIVRLVVVLLALMGTLGVWFYIIAAIIMPKDSDMVYTQQVRYDSQTGRPLYEAGGTVYENRASGPDVQAAPVQDAEFTSTSYSSAETVETAEKAEAAEGTGAPAAEQAEAAAEAVADDFPEKGNVSGSWTESARNTASQAGAQQARTTYQPYEPLPKAQTEKHGNSSRNTGILLIIVGAVILAKTVLPRINLWIPIAIAAIFFGIYLCCRKK